MVARGSLVEPTGSAIVGVAFRGPGVDTHRDGFSDTHRVLPRIMTLRSSAPRHGSARLLAMPPRRGAVLGLWILGIMWLAFVVPTRPAAAQSPGWRSSITSGFKAIGKAMSGKGEKPAPKQAARLPIPPDAHDDDALIQRIAKPPIAEPMPSALSTRPNPIQTASPRATPSTANPEVGPVFGSPTANIAADLRTNSAEVAPPKASEPSAAKLPDVRSFADVVSLASAVGATTKRIVAASFDPAYVRVAAKPQPKIEPKAEAKAEPKPEAKTEAKTVAATKSRSTPPAWTVQGTGPRPPSNQRMDRLKRRIEQVLAVYKRRPLNTQEHTPWEVMHSFLAFGIATDVRVGGPGGGLVNAIGWLNSGGRCRGQTMLAAQDGHVAALKGVGVQGHSAQYLAILAQCRVAANSPLTPQRKSFTVSDLIEEEKLDCKSKTELTFALIAMAHYLHTDATWTSRDGQPWSLERLVAEELEQPIRGAPCGGTHRLFGLAYGCQRRLRATGSLEGIYARADAFVREYQLMTLTKLQNADGSFSTEWYKFPTAQNREDDIDRKIQTTGHMLEWLVASLDQESLYHSRVSRAVEYLTWALASDPSREWSVGPMCHALHALSVYQERVWGTVLPGAVAAFKGPMRAAAGGELQVAEKPSEPGDADGADTKPESTGGATKRAIRR